MGLLSQMVRRVNQGLRGLPARMVGNRYLKRYGRMTVLKIDSAGKVIEAEVLLKGEQEPVRVELRGYSVEGGVFRAEAVTVSRQWMEVLARELLGKGVALPAGMEKYVGLVL